ncbi:hypothetical protein K3G39_19000 [Pontibacter sp. HSC-14F20]|uniref:hypothetical protein n=1 Tax=Pontibacter sp. HSC-14F20 TaxID=2864136 RepID=UPI001C72CC72|nr:hypothetical protein [Pontibacter sp. HSC-14F20]MBX0335328.1 hypothetical protein [Pontibacter sp. HSC-14F20]
MELLYKLNTAITESDRKFKYAKVLAFLQNQEVDALGISADLKGLYDQYSEQIRAINGEMFRPQADYQQILANLHAVEQEVHQNKRLTPALRRYIAVQIFPKTAYCYYKLKDLSQAEHYLEQKFRLGIELVKEGNFFEFYDLLEQVLNRNKVLLAQNRMDECIQQWAELFRFLLNGHSSSWPFLHFDISFTETGLFKILKEYTFFNFLNVYINDYMKFNVYPNPSVIFSPWYSDMEVNTTERLAIYRYINLQERVPKIPLDKFISEVVEFTQLFENKNYLNLRCSLIASLVDKLEVATIPAQQKSVQAAFLIDYLNGLATGIAWVHKLTAKLEKLVSAQGVLAKCIEKER